MGVDIMGQSESDVKGTEERVPLERTTHSLVDNVRNEEEEKETMIIESSAINTEKESSEAGNKVKSGDEKKDKKRTRERVKTQVEEEVKVQPPPKVK